MKCALSFVHRLHKCILNVLNSKEISVKIFIFSGGILTFLILEKIFEASEDGESQNNNKGDENRKKIIGYLNLAANCIDNFIHGLAVASRWVINFIWTTQNNLNCAVFLPPSRWDSSPHLQF